MHPRIAKSCALLFAVTFLLLAGLPLVSNSLVGRGAFFATDTPLDAVHVALGIGLLLAATAGETRAATGLYYSSTACLVLAFAGCWKANGSGQAVLLETIHVNMADDALHGALALMMFLAGASNTASRQLIKE